MPGLMKSVVASVLFATMSTGTSAQEASVSDAWVLLPDDGETSASAFVTVNNPTMYDVYLVSASSAIAGKVEFRRIVDGDSEAVRELTVQAYGKLSMQPDGVHLKLLDLARPLEDGERVSLTVTTDSNIKLQARAVVRKE